MTLATTFETLPHERIPETCTCKWVPVGGGLWKRTGKPFPGLPRCSFDHEAARLRKMTVAELRELAREMGLSSTTRLEKREELVAAIAKSGVSGRESGMLAARLP